MEIERKFLVTHLPSELERLDGVRIDQGYLVVGEDGSEARVRRAGATLTLTVKRGGGLVRSEHEVELTEEQFETLWPTTEGRRVQKVRRAAGDGPVVVELDVYSGSLAGLIVAEVEFPSVEAAGAFQPPDWFGPEVTDDARYKNRALAVDGRPSGEP